MLRHTIWGWQMPGQWFSNRGQMVQVACAVAAVVIGLVSQWGQISSAIDLAAIFKILLFPLGAIFMFQLGQYFSKRTTNSKDVDAKASIIEHTFRTPTIKVGSYFDVDQPLGIRRISASSIQNYKFTYEEVPAAEIEISGSLISLTAGKKVKQISDRKFLLPAYSRSLKDDDCSVFQLRYKEDLVEVTAISVDHINQHAQEIVLTISLFSYRK
jgi:hypothetical protein